MLHPAVKPGVTQRYGIGLFATKPIPVGSVVWHPSLQSLQVTPAEAACLPELTALWLDELGYRLSNGNTILPAGGACFFNHSCAPNIVDTGLDFGIAVRNLEPGEELTLDYTSFIFDPPFEFRCRCDAASCRGTVTNGGPPACPTHLPVAAIRQILQRPQPLRRSLLASSRSFAEIVAGAEVPHPRSICDPPQLSGAGTR